VAGLVNDFRCGYTAFSLILDTAALLEPSAGALRDEAMSDPKGWPDGLARLFREAGLGSVRDRSSASASRAAPRVLQVRLRRRPSTMTRACQRHWRPA